MSSFSKYTSGPWEAEAREESGRVCTEAERRVYFSIEPETNSHAVADTMNRYYTISPEEDAANARLIAAAPELLEALEELVAKGTQSSLDTQTKRAKAAIAKALGS